MEPRLRATSLIRPLRWRSLYSKRYKNSVGHLLIQKLKPFDFLRNIGPQQHSSNALGSVRSSLAVPMSLRWPSPGLASVLLRQVCFGLPIFRFTYSKNPLNSATPLIRPDICGALVTGLTRWYCFELHFVILKPRNFIKILLCQAVTALFTDLKKKITSKRQLNKTLEFTSRLPRHVIHLLIFLCLIWFLFRPNTTPGYHHVQACFAKQSRVLHVSLLLSGHMLVWMYGGTTRQYCCLFAVQHQTLHGKQSTKRKDLRVPSTSNGRCGKPSRSCDVYMESWWAKTLGLRKVFCTLPNNKEIESPQDFWLISVHWY